MTELTLVDPVRSIDGADLEIRPLRPADRRAYECAVGRLSPRTRELRFGGRRGPLTEAEIAHFLDVGHDGREALAVWSPEEGTIVAIGRIEPTVGGAELALVVDDRWQGRGVGSVLIDRLIEQAVGLGYHDLVATTDYENVVASRLLHHHGFRTTGVAWGVIELSRPIAAA
ncbi:MAG TPA: GNAT family N-acetyltransferase [Acidimicrobiales bacterium]|jgi:GNAT superfamily N-acetyltransferase|nr:GNAT family N-acetyltransferase [Acidimicrobiales bacterium]